MSNTATGASIFDKLATVIVDKRNILFFLYGCALIFSLISSSWVSVCDELTDYLPETTETRQGLTIMEDELITFGSARVMLSNVTDETAQRVAAQIEEIDGISSAKLGDGSQVGGMEDEAQPETPQEIAKYLKGSNALLTVTFDGEDDDPVSLEAIAAMRELLAPYDAYVDSEVGYSQADSMDADMRVIMVVAVIIIVLVLLLTSRSYVEVLVLLLTFGAAALLNMGTNFMFGEISFVSDSVTVVLQLALAIDYAIILLHRFIEERETFDTRQACINALSSSIPAISASSMTTISGLLAMMFMQFGIGADMGRVLIKAICFSLLSVFTLMPGLLMLFAKAMLKTQHRSFIPTIDRWGKLVVKLRHIGPPLFALCLVAGVFLSNQCPYVYGYTLLPSHRQDDRQIAQEKINETFAPQNIMALLVPKGDYTREKALLDRLESYEEVDYAMGLANVEARGGYMLADRLTPRQFSEMMDLTYEVACVLYSAYTVDKEDNYGPVVGGIEDYTVPLLDMLLFVHEEKEDGYVKLDDEDEADINDAYQQITDAKAQMLGENYSRMVLNLNLPEEGEETFAFLETIHQEAGAFYDKDQIYLVGEATSDKDLATSFARDNVVISVLSVLFVILVMLFTFQSVGLPILLILVIQGSIWINFSFPTLTSTPIFFMSYLIVTSIQMGANIDYAIVISSRYTEMKESLPPREAIIKALDLAFPTVLTSGTILTAAAFLISRLSTEPSISGLGECLSRGTLLSMFLVMFVLPQILLMGDRIVEKTQFKIKVPERPERTGGTVIVNGRVRGRISGVVDANMYGVIHGEVSAYMENSGRPKLPEQEDQGSPEEDTPDE